MHVTEPHDVRVKGAPDEDHLCRRDRCLICDRSKWDVERLAAVRQAGWCIGQRGPSVVVVPWIPPLNVGAGAPLGGREISVRVGARDQD
jgi:hypothetical protein